MCQVLRDYQAEMLERLRQAWSGNENTRQQSVMVQMPTGTGKTYLMAEVVKSEELRVKSEESLSVASLGESVPWGRAATAIPQPQDGVLIVAHRIELS